VCHPIYGKVIVKIEGIRTITLESDGLKTRYRIDVQNLCRTGRVIASDFPHYYKIAKDLDGIEFDLIYQVLTGAPGITRSLEDCVRERSGFSISLPEGFEKFGANGPPQVCNVTFMGETNTIPE
jgi:hypothetical protein